MRIQMVLAAVRPKRETQEAILGFFLVALGLAMEKKIPNATKLATDLFKQGGNPRYGKPSLMAIQSKKSTPPFSINLGDFDADLVKLAKAIMRTQTRQDKSYNEVARLAHLVKNQVLERSWLPNPVKPERAGAKKTEYQKQFGQYMKDRMMLLLRKGSDLQTIMAELNKELPTSWPRFKTPPGVKGLSVDNTGQLFLGPEKLTSYVGAPVTIWGIRGAEFTKSSKNSPDTYLFGYRTPTAENATKVYKASSIHKSEVNKWKKVSSLGKNLPKIKKAWMTMLANGEALGAVLHFAFLTCARIGGTANRSGGQITYGTTTLMISHVKVKGNTVLVSYWGKGQGGKDAVQEHKLTRNKETAMLIDYIKDRVQTAGPTDILFTDDGHPVKNRVVTGFLQQYVPGIGAHKFRNLRGTELAQFVLSTLTPAKNATEKDVVSMFRRGMEKVGQLLGHYNTKGEGTVVNPSTAIKHYIEPSVMRSWFETHNFDIPAFISRV